MKKSLVIAALVAGGMLFAQQAAPSAPAKSDAPAVTVGNGQTQAVVPVVVEREVVVVPVPVAACPADKQCNRDSGRPVRAEPPWYDVMWQLMLVDIEVGPVMMKGWQLTSGALVVILLVMLMSISSSRRKAAALAAAEAKAAEANPQPGAEADGEARK